MCGTKLKIVMPWSSIMSCRMLSCRVVSHMCELSLRIGLHVVHINKSSFDLEDAIASGGVLTCIILLPHNYE